MSSKNKGFILTETLLAFSLTVLVIMTSSLLIMMVSKTLSNYSRLNQAKIFADSAADLIKDNLVFANDIKINTVDGYERFFKIGDGTLITEKGDIYGRENFASCPMQIEMETKDYGRVNLQVEILDKNSDIVYKTSRVFKINLLSKLEKKFAGQASLITNPVVYYTKESVQ